MEQLIGKRIKRIVKFENTGLGFITDKGSWYFTAQGDCCSQSWFEHFENIPCLLGHTVSTVENIEIDKVIPTNAEGDYVDEKGEHHDLLQLYGIKIVTEAGTAQIEFRNSSNGYYGGYVDLMECAIPAAATELFEDF